VKVTCLLIYPLLAQLQFTHSVATDHPVPPLQQQTQFSFPRRCCCRPRTPLLTQLPHNQVLCGTIQPAAVQLFSSLLYYSIVSLAGATLTSPPPPTPPTYPLCVGPTLDVPQSVTPQQLEVLLNGLLQNEEKQPYSFYIEGQVGGQGSTRAGRTFTDRLPHQRARHIRQQRCQQQQNTS
jgi:hypothetical protein